MKKLTLLIITALAAVSNLSAQNEVDERAMISVKNGITIKKDSAFLMNLRFRMQNRFGFNTVNAYDFDVQSFETRVRRLRLRFDGFVVNRKMRYYFQLSFSKQDQDLENEPVAQTVRDAMVYYHFNKNFYVGIGQTKLPGNRERVISSGNLQLPDRSIANGAMTLDRDCGILAYYTLPVKQMVFNLKGAVTSGDGRNASPINNGLAYTGRFEWLPFGNFADNGDYSEGDQEFEKKPKLSIGVSYCYNQKAARTGGTLGLNLYGFRDIKTFIADGMFKYRGFSLMPEFFARNADNPVTKDTNGNARYVYDGKGINLHASQMLTKRWEIVGRYTVIDPKKTIAAYEKRTEEFQLGTTCYVNGHRIKVQNMLGYRWRSANMNLNKNNRWMYMFQVEFGI